MISISFCMHIFDCHSAPAIQEFRSVNASRYQSETEESDYRQRMQNRTIAANASYGSAYIQNSNYCLL